MATVYFAGLPLDPDIEKLLTKFAGLKIGDKIPYTDIEVCINTQRRTCRWNRVVTRWKKRTEKEQHVWLACERNTCFFVCDQKQRLHGVSMGYNRRAIRNLAVSYSVAANTSPEGLSDVDKTVREHLLLTNSKAAEQLTTDRKVIMAISKPVTRLGS